MKLRIYLARPDGTLVSLYKITRTNKGLYVANTLGAHPMLPADYAHLSYHEDGVCFDHSRGVRTRGKRRPLTGYSGDGSILLADVVIYGVDPSRIVRLDQVRPKDIVLERRAQIGIEMILSDNLQALPLRADRPNAELHVVPMTPRLLVEVWDSTNTFGPVRYPDPANWEWTHLHKEMEKGA